MRCSRCCCEVLGDVKVCPRCESKIEKARILKLRIKGLFNKFNYEFDFENGTDLSIVIAPNGAGKTTILNILKFLIEPTLDNYLIIKNVPFSQAECEMSDGNKINFQKLTNKVIEKYQNDFIKKIDIWNKENLNDIEKIYDGKFQDLIIQNLSKKISKVTNLECFYYKYQVKKDEKLRTVNFLIELNNIEEIAKEKNIQGSTILTEIAYMLIFKKIENICPYPKFTTFNSEIVVDSINKNLKFVDFITTNRASLNFEKDRDLHPIISHIIKNFNTEDVNDYINNIMIIEMINSIIHMNSLEYAKNHIINMLKNKMVFTSKEITEKKLLLLKQVFNKRNKVMNKEIVFSKDKGIEILQDGKVIPLNCLSSGEINDFALMFNVICNPSMAGIILIDEPEISLHVNWQETMLDFFIEASKLNGTQIIVSTHSPHIINNHYDLISKRKVEVND